MGMTMHVPILRIAHFLPAVDWDHLYPVGKKKREPSFLCWRGEPASIQELRC